ncbi:hypothetical protein SDC9_46650 [bioreactor metagenome]|uniref:Uncharacterized protein n=1 Tax=bioreactor metagenome TaxID=1076179 RepID=A0A644W9G0_9ZZZZ
MDTETIRKIISDTIDEFEDNVCGHAYPLPTANAAAPVFDLSFSALALDEQNGDTHFILYNVNEETRSFTDILNPLSDCDGWHCFQNMDFNLVSIVFAERVTDRFGYLSLRLTISDGSQYAVTFAHKDKKED